MNQAFLLASCSPVEEGLDVFWKLVVQHKVHIGDVQAARSYISRNQDGKLSLAEIVQAPLPIPLAHISVKRLTAKPSRSVASSRSAATETQDVEMKS